MAIYDPTETKISWGIPLTAGIADGTFLEVSFDDPAATIQTGSDGSEVITRMHGKKGKAKLTVQAKSPVNDYLSTQAAAWRNKDGGVFPFFVKDNTDNSLALAKTAVIEKCADLKRGKEHSARWPERRGQTGVAEALTLREREVLVRIAEGLSNKDIAARLYLSEGTVRNMLKRHELQARRAGRCILILHICILFFQKKT